MKKLFLALTLLSLPLLASAQLRFGYFSQQDALRAMPAFAIVQKNLSTLRAQYDDEMRRAEEEFNSKYETFLDGQHELAPSILQKRQAELQDIMSRNVAFRQEAQRLLAQAEAEAMEPLLQKLRQTLQQIGHERAYAFILNTDAEAVPFIDPEQGDDISELLRQLLQ